MRDRSGDPWTEWFAHIGRADLHNGPTPRWRMRSALSHEAALHGVGVYLASEDNVNLDVQAGRLVKCVDRGMWRGGYFLLLGQGAHRRKTVRVFREWLLDVTALYRQGDEKPQPNG